MGADPRLHDAAVPSLTATPAQAANIARVLSTLGAAAATPAANVLIAGSVDNFLLERSTFSDFGAGVLAVGEGVPTLLGVPVNGTSFSAPQVAGLASYLWLLSPELRNRPARDTVAAIKANASNGLVIDGVAIADGLINAYATVLSLDETVAVTPSSAKIRLAILDVAGQVDAGGTVIGDGRFDLADLQAFRAVYLDASGAPIEPTTRTYSRFDLNGDGFTSGSRTTRMDLDPRGSTRFGAPQLGDVSATVAGVARSFNEQAVTDAGALCFFASSALYSGTDLAARDALLAELCAAAPRQPAQFAGAVTLEAVTSNVRLTLRTRYDLSVTAEVDTDGIIVLRSLSGSGSETYTYASDALFNCGVSGELAGNRPPESESGTVTGGSGLGILDGSATDQAVIAPRVEGTKVSNSCSGGVWTNTSRASSGSLGSFKGTAVVAGGVTVALDFNANFTDVFGKRTVTTGRLQRSP